MKTILTDGAPSISSRIRQLGLESGVSTACIWVDDWIRWWNTSGLRSSLYICVIVGVFNCYHILIVFNENKWIRCWRKETPSRKQGSTMFHIQMLWLPIISMWAICSILTLRTGTEIEFWGEGVYVRGSQAADFSVQRTEDFQCLFSSQESRSLQHSSQASVATTKLLCIYMRRKQVWWVILSKHTQACAWVCMIDHTEKPRQKLQIKTGNCRTYSYSWTTRTQLVTNMRTRGAHCTLVGGPMHNMHVRPQ